MGNFFKVMVLGFTVLFGAGIMAESENPTQEAMEGRNFSKEAIERLSPDSKIPIRGSIDSIRQVRAKGWEWDHEVRVFLPATYHHTNKSYPTLWVTDNSLELIQAALSGTSLGMAPELIVVAVGPPGTVNMAEFQRRRTYDFTPKKSLMGHVFATLPEETLGGAPGFLDFLVNQLRPMLAKEYRMDLNDQGYAGHSGGGMFGLYVLLNKPESFHKYIISSPAEYQPWLDMEERWYAKNKDLKAKVFLSAGEGDTAGIYGAGGTTMNVSIMPPGQGPCLHSHDATYETFFVLEGKIEFRVGPNGEEKIVLEKWDTFSCPPKVYRGFKNVGDTDAVLLTTITGPADARDDVGVPPSVGEEVQSRFGNKVLDAFKKLATFRGN